MQQDARDVLQEVMPLFIYLFSSHDNAFIPKRYVAKERQEARCRPSDGQLRQKRSTPSRCAMRKSRGQECPLTKEM